jgi:O-acetyl-ADP-ribose deacetylase (regulator of RNase III)
LNEIAFCCISTGIFGFDKSTACATAIASVFKWLQQQQQQQSSSSSQNNTLPLNKIIFVTFTDEDEALYRHHLQAIGQQWRPRTN